MEVRLRGGFSDRNGLKKENITMQITELDERTRIVLINTTKSVLDQFAPYKLEKPLCGSS